MCKCYLLYVFEDYFPTVLQVMKIASNDSKLSYKKVTTLLPE